MTLYSDIENSLTTKVTALLNTLRSIFYAIDPPQPEPPNKGVPDTDVPDTDVPLPQPDTPLEPLPISF